MNRRKYIQPQSRAISATLYKPLLTGSGGLKALRQDYDLENWEDFDGDIDIGRRDYSFLDWLEDGGDGVSGGRKNYGSAKW